MSKFGLALGGGGARGLAHIGVLKVLEQKGLEIHSITGCSMGAIIGGLYAYFGSIKQVEDFILDIINHPKFLELGIDKLSENHKPDKNYFEQFFDYVGTRVQALRALNRLSYFDEELTDEMYSVIPDVPVENFQIKFSAIATDLISGEEINFTEGSLRKIIKASSAIPGIFPPVKFNNYFLIDGSASESVPAGKVRDIGADRVLAVDVTRELKIIEEPKNVFEILYRAEDISSYHLSMIRLEEADLVISPDVKNLSWADFDEAEKIIAAGEKAANENIESILKLYRRNSYIVKLKQKLKKIVGEI
ncbi:MAG: patatin-like phospholipase family protein [Ignavibacterium sp.]|jgi:NTE family protein|uniref:patatin-like phospholipase family protein n=1 Tax=Ignavibacterium sp. TaxID=2651167 RepID=UPI003299DD36